METENEIKERVSLLEVVLGEFIVQTNKSLNQLAREMKEFKDEMSEFKDEMSEFKDEMSEFKDEMSEFKDEMRLDRKEMNKKWGELANRLGTLAEDIAAPNMRTIAQQLFGCEYIDHFGVRIERRNIKARSIINEFDVVLACQDYLFINETKSRSDNVYIDQFTEKLALIFEYFPEHSGKTVVPVFSSLSLPEKTVAYLTEKNILAMAMGGETMELLNFDVLKSRWIK